MIKKPYKYTSKEEQARERLQQFCITNQIKFHYYLGVSIYFLDNQMPLFFAHSAPFVYVKGDLKGEKNKKELIEKYEINPSLFIEFKTYKELQKKLANNPNFYLINCTGDDNFGDYPNFIVLNHGIDEDYIWTKLKKIDNKNKPAPIIYGRGFLSMLFTESHEKLSINFASEEDIKAYYKIDPQKKTVLYSSSISGSTTCDDIKYIEFIKTYQDEVVQQLKILKESYNVILRLHPLLEDNIFEELRKKGFIIAPSDKFPSFKNTVKVADLIIGPPTTIVCFSTYFHDKPIIRLLPFEHKYLNKAKQLFEMNSEIMLTEKHIYSITSDKVDKIAETVDLAFSDNMQKTNIEKSIAKQNYFKRWYGEITKYEDYRTFLIIFDNIKRIEKKSINSLKKYLEKIFGETFL